MELISQAQKTHSRFSGDSFLGKVNSPGICRPTSASQMLHQNLPPACERPHLGKWLTLTTANNNLLCAFSKHTSKQKFPQKENCSFCIWLKTKKTKQSKKKQTRNTMIVLVSTLNYKESNCDSKKQQVGSSCALPVWQ